MPNKRIILDKEKLYDLYCINMLSQKDVAIKLGCSVDTVRENLRKYNISAHTPSYHAHEQKVFLNNQHSIL